MPTPLEAVTADLDLVTADHCGDTFEYSDDGVNWRNVVGVVRYNESVGVGGSVGAIGQTAEVEIFYRDCPDKPTAASRVKLPKHYGNHVFELIQIKDNELFTGWLFALKKVAA